MPLKTIKAIATLDDLDKELRALNTLGKSDPPFNPMSAAVIELLPEFGPGGRRIYDGYARRAGDVIFRGFEAGVLKKFDALHALNDLILADPRARYGNGVAVIEVTLSWLKTCGHNLYGSGHHNGPFTAIAESLKVLAKPSRDGPDRITHGEAVARFGFVGKEREPYKFMEKMRRRYGDLLGVVPGNPYTYSERGVTCASKIEKHVTREGRDPTPEEIADGKRSIRMEKLARR
jgi:hypothetical protein